MTVDTTVTLSDIRQNSTLQHQGVKGMKWGVRKDRSVGLTITKKSAPKNKLENQSEDSKAAGKLRTKKVHELSNAELTALNRRVELERRYKDLNPSKFAQGMKIVTDIVNTATTVQKAYKLVKDPLGQNGKGGGKGSGKTKSGISDTLAEAKAAAMKRTSSKKVGEMTLSEIRNSTVKTVPEGFFTKK